MNSLFRITVLAAQFPLYPAATAILSAIFLWGLVRLLSRRSGESSDNDGTYESDDFDESEDDPDDP
ncbi:MAG: hypothetical protein WC100_14875 [Sterolibacterium sp.]